MLTRRTVLGAGSIALAAISDRRIAFAQDANALYEKAKSEGSVSIYTSTDDVQGRPLLDAFRTAHPGIRVDYNDIGTNGAYNRVISEAAAKQVGSDVVWTSAMDLQMVLVQRGLADSYMSPQAASLPDWATYNDTLYATSVEPVAILYNKAQLANFKLPRTRAELVTFLRGNKDALKGRICTFDPEKSGSGFLFFSNDVRTTNDTWDLVKAFGAADGKVYGSSGAMREKIVSGEHWLAFNIIGSYAMEWASKNPALGTIITADHAAALSRVAHISKGAPHPNAARLFLDFMLSQAGQSAIASSGAPSVRSDVTTGLNLKSLNELAGGQLKPIPLTAALLEATEPKNRAEFFRRWKESLRG